jgi:hypothetical protein
VTISPDTWESLLRQVGPAHHAAFAATDGEDPDWPLWYSRWLLERLPPTVGENLDESRLSLLLEEAAVAHEAGGATEEWPTAYARFLSERAG